MIKQEGGYRLHDKRARSKDDILISIVTVCLNFGQTLERTIDSVAGQNHPQVEHIIVDGCSTDNTLDILKRKSDKISYWVSEPDSGIGQANNKGIRLATGDVIVLLPADDFFEPDFCAILAKAFRENPSADYVYGDSIFYDKNSVPLYRFVNNPINYLGIKKAVYDAIGTYWEEIKLHHDVEFLFRMRKNGKRGVYVGSLVKHMKEGGISTKRAVRELSTLMKIEIKYGASPVGAWFKMIRRYFVYNIMFFLEKIFGPKGRVFVSGLTKIFGRNRADTMIIVDDPKLKY